MIQIATTWEHIRKGDTIRISLFARHQVVLDIRDRTEGIGILGKWREATLEGNPGTRWFGLSRPVLLVHRPLPEGKTEAEARNRVRYRARLFAESGKVIDLTKLCEDLDVYELGKK